MIYEIIYDAVIKKANTTPPNDYIGNVEMAAGIGIVMYKIKRNLDLSEVNEPEDIRKAFLDMAEETNKADFDETCEIIFQKVMKYQVKKMVNETIEDLKLLVSSYDKVLAGEIIYREED